MRKNNVECRTKSDTEECVGNEDEPKKKGKFVIEDGRRNSGRQVLGQCRIEEHHERNHVISTVPEHVPHYSPFLQARVDDKGSLCFQAAELRTVCALPSFSIPSFETMNGIIDALVIFTTRNF